MEKVPSTPNLVPESERTVETILQLYTERIGPMNENIAFRLREYADRIKIASPTDWFSWMHRAIMTTATKTKVEQRNIAYLIGIYKSWLTYGMGNCKMTEVTKLKSKIAKSYQVVFTEEAMHKLSEVVLTYGIFDTVEVLNNMIGGGVDMAYEIVCAVERRIKERKEEQEHE